MRTADQRREGCGSSRLLLFHSNKREETSETLLLSPRVVLVWQVRSLFILLSCRFTASSRDRTMSVWNRRNFLVVIAAVCGTKFSDCDSLRGQRTVSCNMICLTAYALREKGDQVEVNNNLSVLLLMHSRSSTSTAQLGLNLTAFVHAGGRMMTSAAARVWLDVWTRIISISALSIRHTIFFFYGKKTFAFFIIIRDGSRPEQKKPSRVHTPHTFSSHGHTHTS